MVKPLSLDGCNLEGGGQLVRVALSLSALCSIPIRIHNIRGKRAGGRQAGGLKESHLAALKVLQAWSFADVEGDHVGSTEVVFVPGKGNKCLAQTRTIELERPGSVWLILQALLPFVLFSGLLWPEERSRDSTREVVGDAAATAAAEEKDFCLRLRGGTNVSKSMSGEYVQQVLLPVLEKIGLPKVEVEIVKRGWAGNASDIGEVLIRIPLRPRIGLCKMLEGFRVEGRGKLAKIHISVVSTSAVFQSHLQQSIVKQAKAAFPAEIFASGTQEFTLSHVDSGNERRLYILLVAHTETGWRIGRDYLGGKVCKNEKARETMVHKAGEAAVNGLRRELERGGCVDEFMQDQLVVFQVLARGESVVFAGAGRERGTLHAQTVRWVCEEMLGTRGVKFDRSGGCKGLGWEVREENAAVNDVHHDLEGLAR
jgi:RNA 3'-terminal phosphate cyclase (ATP)